MCGEKNKNEFPNGLSNRNLHVIELKLIILFGEKKKKKERFWGFDFDIVTAISLMPAGHVDKFLTHERDKRTTNFGSK